MSLELKNPWNVEDLDDFLYFCCPECDLKDQSKVQFLQHALDQHPNAKECVQQFNEFVIKGTVHVLILLTNRVFSTGLIGS